jgi:hypothetical protein
LKVLSIQQPWTWLIANGLKDIENRTWDTSYRGPLLLHAGKSVDKDAFYNGELFVPYWRHIAQDAVVAVMPRRQEEYQTGGIVGIALLSDCVRRHPSTWFRGPIGFVLANARPLPFTEVRGQRYLFDVPQEILESLQLGV